MTTMETQPKRQCWQSDSTVLLYRCGDPDGCHRYSSYFSVEGLPPSKHQWVVSATDGSLLLSLGLYIVDYRKDSIDYCTYDHNYVRNNMYQASLREIISRESWYSPTFRSRGIAGNRPFTIRWVSELKLYHIWTQITTKYAKIWANIFDRNI